jgi:tetratricopeptide (TPR) repeat protein
LWFSYFTKYSTKNNLIESIINILNLCYNKATRGGAYMRKSSHRRVRLGNRPKTVHRKKREFYKVDNTRDLDQILDNSKLVQDLLGFSRDNVATMFAQAIGFLQVNRVEEAIQAFSFLTRVNPYVADFWLGLGLGYTHHEEHSRAFDAFLMAITMDPTRIDIYGYAVDCCIEMKHFSQAEALIEDAEGYARRHHRADYSKYMLQEAKLLKEQVESYKAPPK